MMRTILQAFKEIYIPNEKGGVFTFPEDFPAFKGHFPQEALLPAVVQIELGLFVIAQHLNKEIKLKEIKKAKFIAPIFPKDTVTVIFNRIEQGWDIKIMKENTLISAFQLKGEIL